MARKTVKAKAPKRKPVAKKKAAPKAKATAKKKAPAKKKAAPKAKPATRKKPIGFEMMKSHQNKIEKLFEEIQGLFDECGESLNEYVYEGKKKNAAVSRAQLMDITKKSKELRNIIQEAKTKLKPIYKS